jgi:hypothetical protein
VEGSFEHGNKPLSSIKFWEFFSPCTTGGYSQVELQEVSLVIYPNSSEIKGGTQSEGV